LITINLGSKLHSNQFFTISIGIYLISLFNFDDTVETTQYFLSLNHLISFKTPAYVKLAEKFNQRLCFLKNWLENGQKCRFWPKNGSNFVNVGQKWPISKNPPHGGLNGWFQ